MSAYEQTFSNMGMNCNDIFAQLDVLDGKKDNKITNSQEINKMINTYQDNKKISQSEAQYLKSLSKSLLTDGEISSAAELRSITDI